MRYYDTLEEPNEVCLSRASDILSALDLSPDVPTCSNKFRQKDTECGWWVMHYTEAEVRRDNGEGWGDCKALSSMIIKDMRVLRTMRLLSSMGPTISGSMTISQLSPRLRP